MTSRSYAVIARIFSIDLLQHAVLTRSGAQHSVEINAVHAIDTYATWTLLHLQTTVYGGF